MNITEAETYSRSKLTDLWKQATIKSLMAPAQRILEGKPKKSEIGDGTAMLVKIIPAVIVSLSLASVTNMAHRAYSHHASNSSYAIGFGLAIMVPVIVFTALRLNSGWARLFAWLCAIAFAFASGSIQFQIYNFGKALTVDTLFSLGVNLEALAFGYGVPFAECVLAGLEGMLVWQLETKAKDEEHQIAKEAEQAAAKAKDEEAKKEEARIRAAQEESDRNRAAQEEADRKERERLEWQAEQDRKQSEWKAEQERKAAEHAQKLELQREKESTKLHKPAQEPAQEGASTTGRTIPDMQRIVHLSKPEQAKKLHGEGFSNTEIAQLLTAHRNSVGNWLKEKNGHSKPK